MFGLDGGIRPRGRHPRGRAARAARGAPRIRGPESLGPHRRLGAVQARFRPLPVGGDVARAWGALQARVRREGAQPRARPADLLIAATAQVHDAVLLTHDVDDLRHVADVVRVRRPTDPAD